MNPNGQNPTLDPTQNLNMIKHIINTYIYIYDILIIYLLLDYEPNRIWTGIRLSIGSKKKVNTTSWVGSLGNQEKKGSLTSPSAAATWVQAPSLKSQAKLRIGPTLDPALYVRPLGALITRRPRGHGPPPMTVLQSIIPSCFQGGHVQQWHE